jgi:hypothetical protein
MSEAGIVLPVPSVPKELLDMNSHVFSTSYAAALYDHVSSASEDTLRAAYELGRTAVSHNLSLLDLVAVHHDVLLLEIRRSADAGEAESVTRAAGDFLLESLSAFEMARRVHGEAREAAALERRQVEMLRQLSNFLGDASLALNASESREEVLRLIAEQTREILGAKLCIASLIEHGETRALQASSRSNAAGRDEVVDGRHLSIALPPSPSRRPARRSPSGEHDPLPEDIVSEQQGAPENSLTVTLSALDGEELGSIQLFGKEHGEFTAVDEDALVHLAQMASAAIERVRLYGALKGARRPGNGPHQGLS